MWVGTKATSGELGNHATSHHISSFLPLLACQHCEPERTGRKYRLLRTPPWIGRQKLSPETCVWPVWPLVLSLPPWAQSPSSDLYSSFIRDPSFEATLVFSTSRRDAFCGEREVAGSYSDIFRAFLIRCFDMFWYVVFFDIFLGIWSTSWFTSHHIKMINTTGPGDPVHRRLEGSSLTLPIKGRSVSEIVSETTGTFCMSGKG